jgi:hypothetical protein
VVIITEEYDKEVEINTLKTKNTVMSRQQNARQATIY